MVTNQKITVEVIINAPVEKVWKIWTTPGDITKWNSPLPDWHTPRAEHELKVDGTFTYRMEAKDGSTGFDFIGVFDVIQPKKYIEYTINDGRKVQISFTSEDSQTKVSETFDVFGLENQTSLENERTGWQAILDSFKIYTEKKKVHQANARYSQPIKNSSANFQISH